MPVLDEATFSGRRAGSLPASVSTSNGAPVNLPNGVAKAAAAPLVDLLDLSSEDAPAPSSAGGDFLQDLLGVDIAPVSTQPGLFYHLLSRRPGNGIHFSFIATLLAYKLVHNLFPCILVLLTFGISSRTTQEKGLVMPV